MGQAKLRGSFECRVVEGTARRTAEAIARKQARELAAIRATAQFDALPTAVKHRRIQARLLIATAIGLSASTLLPR
jgi:hypothetical protein